MYHHIDSIFTQHELLPNELVTWNKCQIASFVIPFLCIVPILLYSASCCLLLKSFMHFVIILMCLLSHSFFFLYFLLSKTQSSNCLVFADTLLQWLIICSYHFVLCFFTVVFPFTLFFSF